MKTISAALKAHMALDVTTLSTCWKLVRKDGTILGFTDCSHDITFTDTFSGVSQTVVYAQATGFIPSGIRSANDMSVDNMEVISVLDSAGITNSDLAAGLYDGATLIIFIVNYLDLSMGSMILKGGYIGEVSRHRNSFNAEVRGKAQALGQVTGRTYQSACDADLGDTRCTVNLAPYTFSGSVTSVTNQRTFLDTANVQADHYFQFGLLTWTSGLNSGMSMEVADWRSGTTTFTLKQGMPRTIQVGDTYSAYKGCNKKLSDAKGCTGFSNVVNFRGFPTIPGVDKLMRYPNAH